jgi:hypothetical protein
MEEQTSIPFFFVVVLPIRGAPLAGETEISIAEPPLFFCPLKSGVFFSSCLVRPVFNAARRVVSYS